MKEKEWSSSRESKAERKGRPVKNPHAGKTPHGDNEGEREKADKTGSHREVAELPMIIFFF
ncbi:MAG: hypothetical protein PHT99_08885 [Methanoregula sp.]|nr:hypothetical protein [Methanoregula sp.]